MILFNNNNNSYTGNSTVVALVNVYISGIPDTRLVVRNNFKLSLLLPYLIITNFSSTGRNLTTVTFWLLCKRILCFMYLMFSICIKGVVLDCNEKRFSRGQYEWVHITYWIFTMNQYYRYVVYGQNNGSYTNTNPILRLFSYEWLRSSIALRYTFRVSACFAWNTIQFLPNGYKKISKLSTAAGDNGDVTAIH